jgi:hypothetical protein
MSPVILPFAPKFTEKIAGSTGLPGVGPPVVGPIVLKVEVVGLNPLIRLGMGAREKSTPHGGGG